MRKVKSAIARGESLVAELRRQQRAIESEGRTEAWTREQKAAAAEAAKGTLKNLKVEIMQEAIAETDTFQAAYWGHLKPSGVPSGEKSFVLQDAVAALKGKDPEQAIGAYRRRVADLDPDERKNRWIWDVQLLEAVQGDPAFVHAAEKAIDDHRGYEEKSALKALKKARRIREHLPTITAQLEQQIEDAAAGEKEPTDRGRLDLVELFDQIEHDAASEVD